MVDASDHEQNCRGCAGTSQLDLEGPLACVVLRGHFVLPDGTHTNVCIDRVALMQTPHLVQPLVDSLCQEIGAANAEALSGASPGGCIIATQVAVRLGLAYYSVEFTDSTPYIHPKASLSGRIVLADDVLTDARQYDAVLHLLRSRDANVVALAAAIALRHRRSDLPIDSIYVGRHLHHATFRADALPSSLASTPPRKLPTWAPTLTWPGHGVG